MFKRLLAMTAVLAMVALAAVPPALAIEPPEDAKEMILGAGTTQFSVGTVTAWISEGSIHIHVQTLPDWELRELHIIAVADLAEIPVNSSGNPIFGHFPYNLDFEPPVTEHLAHIPLDETWEPGQTIYIMLHAAVNDETAFAHEYEFGSTRFAYYFTLVLPEEEGPGQGDDDDPGDIDDEDPGDIDDEDPGDIDDEDPGQDPGDEDPGMGNGDDDDVLGIDFENQLPVTGTGALWLLPAGALLTGLGGIVLRRKR